jgi:hypothetical protein
MMRAGLPSVRVEAAIAILHVVYGPPSPEANKELAVHLESQGVNVDELFREAAKAPAELRSRH